jgi:hypothetical protein
VAYRDVPCNGGNDEVGGHGWGIEMRAALVLGFAEPTKVGQLRSDANIKRKVPPLHRSSLCDDLFRVGMTHLSRDDRVGESWAFPIKLDRTCAGHPTVRGQNPHP